MYAENLKQWWIFFGVDQNQMPQILLNPFLNACHAMPKDGDLFAQTAST